MIEHTHQSRFLREIARHVRYSAERHLRPSPLREFFLEMLDESHHLHEKYLSASGLKTIASFISAGMDEQADERFWVAIARKVAVAAAYFHCENISDNILIGTASATHPGNVLKAEKEAVVRRFNDTILRLLRAQDVEVYGSLEAVAEQARKLSWVESSLVSSEMGRLIDSWALSRGTPHLSIEVEYSLLDLLAWNVHACVDFIQDVQESYPHIASAFRQGVSARYEASDVSLDLLNKHHPVDPEVLTRVGTDTILVVPTLWYYCAMTCPAEMAWFAQADAARRAELERLIWLGSLLTRLFNDLGALLTAPAAELDLLGETLWREWAVSPQGLGQALLKVQESLPDKSLLGRLLKDITFGEINLALLSSAGAPVPPLAFIKALHYWRNLYQESMDEMASLLSKVATHTGSRRIPTIVERWVKFHQVLYSAQLKGSAHWDYYY
jgi:hypothetical protein